MPEYRLGDWSRTRAAFTVTELLVCLAVLAVLLALLIPAVALARRSARSLECVNNLREIARASLMRAQDSGGYLPLAGDIRVPASTAGLGSLPAALNDPERKRYVYVRQRGVPGDLPTLELVAPYPAALLPYLNHRSPEIELNQGNLFGWDRLNRGSPAVRVFACPEQPENPDGLSPVPVVSLTLGTLMHTFLWDVRTTYGLNGVMLGFSYDRPQDSVAGRLAAARDPSAVVLAADVSLAPRSHLLVWQLAASRGSTDAVGVSLADVLGGSSAVVGPALTPSPHRRGINVAFLDGHVDTLPVGEPGGLSGALLSPRP